MKHGIFLIVLFIVGCTFSVKERGEGKKNGLVKSFKDGKLYSAINYKDGYKDGKAYAYYSNGQVNLEMNYVRGAREGESKRFYENGKLYQTTEYKNNVIHGVRKKYRVNGKLISEIRYEENEPCIGLKEFLIEGDFKKYYPTIIITAIDSVAKKGKYIITVAMSNGDKKAEFFAGYLTDSGCLHRGLYKVLVDKNTGIGTISYDLKPKQNLDFELNIIALVHTIHDNPYITQNRINILYKQ